MNKYNSEYAVKRAERMGSIALMSAGVLIAGAISLLIYYFKHFG